MRPRLLLLAVFLTATPGLADEEGPPRLPPPSETQQAYVTLLNSIPTADRLSAWHDLFCEEPHPAGTEADTRMVEKLAQAFADLGLEVDVDPFHAYLPRFVRAQLAVVLPGGGRIALPLRERPVREDPATLHPDVTPGWNAYSGSGEVEAEVVYANYGTKEDFEQLAELGVSVEGKIVVARYGKNFRGFKAKFAEAAGA
ncbi:MAG: glutamate carboxypeptidase, partial [Planctomycetota bacterium]